VSSCVCVVCWYMFPMQKWDSVVAVAGAVPALKLLPESLLRVESLWKTYLLADAPELIPAVGRCRLGEGGGAAP
jgi:hypothetical protein